MQALRGRLERPLFFVKTGNIYCFILKNSWH